MFKAVLSSLRRIVLVCVACCASLVFPVTSQAGLPCDDLGARWLGCELATDCSQWQFEFRRRACSGTVWNGYWSHAIHGRFQGTVTISKSGSTVRIVRPSAGGVSCNYVGTWYPRDTTNARPYRVEGTYSCSNGGGGGWRANIVGP